MLVHVRTQMTHGIGILEFALAIVGKEHATAMGLDGCKSLSGNRD